MIKLIVAVKRRADMSPEEFQRHWREVHGPLIREAAVSKRYVHRYIQCHTLLESYADGEPAFDGTAELWFDSVADQQAFFSDPEYLARIHPDESNFADLERCQFFLTQEETVC